MSAGQTATSNETVAAACLTREQLAVYDRDGYHSARRLFDAGEIAALRQRFDGIAQRSEPIAASPSRDTGNRRRRRPRTR